MSPRISVVIPVHNNPKGLQNTLKSLVIQDFPSDDFEIIIADNDSTDNTVHIAKKFAKKHPKLICVVLENKIHSSYAARNRGISASKGSIIAFIDADMSVNKDWLTQIISSLEKNQTDCFACKVEVFTENNSIFGLYNKMTGFPVESYVHEGCYAPTCCLVVRKNIFEEEGLFDSRLVSGGDYEFGNRLYKAGYKIWYDSNIVMKHPARSSFKQFFSKYFRIGKGVQQVSAYYPEYHNKTYRNVLNPLYYLPGAPWKFFKSKEREKSEVWNEASFRIKIGFYLVCWIEKLAKHMGYIYESLYKKNKKI